MQSKDSAWVWGTTSGNLLTDMPGAVPVDQGLSAHQLARYAQ